VTTGAGVPRRDWKSVGEEAILLARLAPGIPVAVARRREEALDCFRAQDGVASLLVLDGGFQHRRLAADLALVTIDASRRPGSGRLLPWGDMREPWRELRRADAIVLHRSELCVDPEGWDTFLARIAPGAPRFWTRNVLGEVRSLQGEDRSWAGLRALRLGLWTALANPDALRTALEREGILPLAPCWERDHAPFDAGRAARLRSLARAERLDAILVTAKDAVKLEAWAAELPPVLVLHARFEFVAGQAALDRLLRERLGSGA
jgi:tetraacyldisaccharide 4'-kinase